MLSFFSLKNYRCFKEFSISPLERINLVTGMNNVGKTALLESLFLFAGATNPSLAMSVNAFRGIGAVEVKTDLQSETPWSSLFNNFNEHDEIVMIGKMNNSKQRKLTIKIARKQSELVIKSVPNQKKENFILSEATGKMLEFEYINEAGKTIKSKMVLEPQGIKFDRPPVIPWRAIFLAARHQTNPAEDAKRFSNIEITLQQDVLLKILNLIEPKLKRMTVGITADVPMIYGDIGLNRLLPLPIMGEGLVRVCSIVLAIANAPDGVVFIDEIENGVHHSIMEKLWIGIAEAARQFNTQLFATTHSRECIIAAHYAFSQSLVYDFLLHRLDRRNGIIEAKTYDKGTLSAAIQTELEVR